jgi:hypothetical protein
MYYFFRDPYMTVFIKTTIATNYPVSAAAWVVPGI